MFELLSRIGGYVLVRLTGDSPERFMNLCSNRNLFLWDIRKNQNEYYMCMKLSDYWKIRPIAKKTKTRAVVLKRYGLPFVLPDIIKRNCFLIGLGLAIFFWLWSSRYVWRIEIEGNYRITDNMFCRFLKSEDILVGKKKSNIDIGQLEKDIRRYFGQITWVSAKFDGSILLIDIKEYDALIETGEKVEKEPCSIVSDVGGTIVYMIVRNGVPKVKIGDTIERGMVLVDGKIPVYNDDATIREYLFTDSDADITVEREISFYDFLPYEYQKKVYTGRVKSIPYIKIAANTITFPYANKYLKSDSVRDETTPDLLRELNVPISFGKEYHREYMIWECEYSLKEAENLLRDKLLRFITSLEEKGVQIIEKNVKIDSDTVSWTIHGDFVIREPIGRKIDVNEIYTIEELNDN